MSDNRIPSIDARKMVKTLRKLGFQRDGDKGDHQIYRKGEGKDARFVQVPWHSNIPRGSIGLMLRQGQIDRRDFLKALK